MADETLGSAPRGTGFGARVAGPLERLKSHPLAARAAVPALATALAALALFAWIFLVPPERTPLYSTLGDADKAAVVDALEKAGMKVALDPKTGAVMLPAEDHARARMLLAAGGLPRAAPGPDEILADVPLGTSRALEGARLKSAQERELARSIEALDGVAAARVIIAQPDTTPFVRDVAPVTASVTVTLAPGRTLSASQARAIVHLVAGAVPGLSPDRVAIADQTGRLIAGEPGNADDEATNRRLALQARMEARAREAILTLLGPIVGPENVSAQVSVDLDFAAREAAQEKFDPQGAVRSEALNRSTSTEPRAIGIPGAMTNAVPAATNVTATPPPVQQPTETSSGQESSTRNFELSRAVEVTSRSGGEIRRLTAAVAVREDALGPAKGRAQRLKEIEALVQGAVGFNAQRGDRIAVAARPFATPAASDVPLWKEPVVVESSKWLATALVAIALLFFVVRPLMARLLKRNTDLQALPTDGPAMLVGHPVPAEEALDHPIDYAGKLERARQIAASDAARATAVARKLLAGPVPAPVVEQKV
jgi:flagellar M-ring protein FliF